MTDIKAKTVLIIGAGPGIIGQSSECDEGAVEAALALAGQGYRIITVDSNPDAVMTSPDWASQSYMEPLTADNLAQIISAEKPDAVLPTFAGRQGLHLAAELVRMGIMKAHNVALWSLSAHSLKHLLNRDTLNTALNQIGLNTPSIFVLENASAAAEKAQELGFPVVLRRANADLMPDGILVYNQDELRQYAVPAAGESCGTISIEASLLAWQQIELEILRDAGGDIRIAGCVEYLDTAGIHPGDAIAVCPPQSLSIELAERLTVHAKSIADHLQILGNATIRFAYQPAQGAVLVLAVHPRYTRTSALVSRTAGLSLATLAGLLAAGYRWDQLPADFKQPNASLKETISAQSNTVGVKWPCWNFKRLKLTADRLGPQMKAVGQHLGFGLDFKEALQKASRAAVGNDLGLGDTGDFEALTSDQILSALSTANSRRLPMVCEALRRGTPEAEVNRITHIAPWFLSQLKELVDIEARLARNKGRQPSKTILLQAKAAGFGNGHLSQLLQIPAERLQTLMADNNIHPGRQSLSESTDRLRFFTYNRSDGLTAFAGDKKILIIGSGAYRIGQGPECDFGIWQAVDAVRSQGYEPVVLNCNLAGITTGRAMPAGCYCEPVTSDSIQEVIAQENPSGIITQFAGLQSSALAISLARSGAKVLGPPLESLLLTNDRPAFKKRMRELGIPQPGGGIAHCAKEAAQLVAQIGYPVQVRPIKNDNANIIELLRDKADLQVFMDASDSAHGYPLMVEQFLEYAIEAQAETLCDGDSAQVAAVMEHIELAGVHAGDSACVLPPYSISPRHVETIVEYCRKIAVALGIKGLINFRFAIYRDTVYLLDAVCNICRNLAVVNRVHQVDLAAMAARLMLGARLSDLHVASTGAPSRVAVRAAVFPFTVFNAEDPLLGAQMRSIGQALSLADTFGLAYFKALEAAAAPLPTQGTVLITVTDEDKTSILEPARIFQELGFQIMATRGTHNALEANGIESKLVRKLGFGRPNLLDEIKNGNVQMVINTPTGGQGQIDDSVIRKTAIIYRVANMTTPASAMAAAKGIAARRKGKDVIRPLPASTA